MTVLIFVIFWTVYFLINLWRRDKAALRSFGCTIVLAALFSLNYQNSDSDMYRQIYQNCMNAGLVEHADDLLYITVNKLFFCMGLDYNAFHCIFMSVCVVMLATYIKRHTNRYWIAYGVYFFCSGLLDYVQQRQFAAMCILMLALDILSGKKSVRNIIRYTSVVLLAATMHISSLIYLIYLPVLFKTVKTKKRFYAIGVVVMIGIIAILRNGYVATIMNVVAGEGVTSFYLHSQNFADSPYKIVFDIVVQQGLWLAILAFDLYYGRKNRDTYKETVFKIVTLTVAFSPLNLASTQFKRMSRIMIVPGICSIQGSNNTGYRFISTKKIAVGILLCCYVALYMQVTLRANPQLMTDLFNHNLLFGSL